MQNIDDSISSYRNGPYIGIQLCDDDGAFVLTNTMSFTPMS